MPEGDWRIKFDTPTFGIQNRRSLRHPSVQFRLIRTRGRNDPELMILPDDKISAV